MDEPPTRLRQRLIGTVTTALMFLFVTWRLGWADVTGDLRILSGPARCLPSPCAAVPIALLLLCIFAVGVERNSGTAALTILGLLAWIAIGLVLGFVESEMSC